MHQLFIKFFPGFIRSKLVGRATLQKTITNAGWLFADKIVRMGVGLFVTIIVARYLGPKEFGIYNYALAFVALFSAIAALGLDGIVVRNVIRDPSCKEETLGSAFVLKLVGGIVTILLTSGTIFVLRPDDSLTQWMVEIIALGTIFQAFDTIDFWFQSQIQSKYTVYAKNIAFLSISMVKVVLVIIKAPLIAFAWAGLLEIVLGSIGLVITYKMKGYSLFNWNIKLSRAQSLLKDSWPLILSGIVIMIYMRIDQIMLGEMLGDDEVGIYSAAVRLSEVWYFIPTAIVASVFPSIIEARENDRRSYIDRIQKLYVIMTLIAFSIALPTTFLSNKIINFLYGDNFNQAISVLTIHIWAGVFVFLGVASGQFLLAENYTKIAFYRTLVGALFNILLNLIMIPAYGVNGAAITTLVSYFIATFFLIFIKNTREQSLMMFKSILLFPLLRKKNYA